VPEPVLAAASGPIVLPASSDSTADDVMNLLQEATACYLRRDLARAEALLQKCLELRPGDKRALQNLERIRRKKPQ
jgi:Flp pilus assembly protein TadD